MKECSCWGVCGAVVAAIAVAAGAFGAHGLEEWLAKIGRAETFETAVRYQIYHALALIVLGLFQEGQRSALFSWSGRAFLTGILLFSGCLYAWIGSHLWLEHGWKPFVMIVPLGGLSMILGWILLGWGIHKSRS